jgi:radical SAM superfamily enzyme YgiQ (UPF0313 family)
MIVIGLNPKELPNMSHLDAIILFPPPMDRIARVYPAPHFLSACVNNNGYHARPLDLNLIALGHLADSALLDETIDALAAQTVALENKAKLTEEETKRYHAQLRSIAGLLFAKQNNVHTEAYKDLIRMENEGIRYTRVFFDLYQKTFGLFYRQRFPTLEEIVPLASSPASVVLRNLLKDEIQAQITEKQVPVVGFSIPFYEQLVPAIALATEIKNNLNHVHICFGGPVITLLSGTYLKGLFDLTPIDSFVKFEGEIPLLELLRAKKTGGPIDDIDNLLTKNNASAPADKKRAKKPLPRPVARHHRFASADIQHIPENSPIPITQSCGCYWKKCAFCDYINLHRDKAYRPRTVDAVIDDINYYTDMGFCNFRMLAEAIPPRHAFEIAAALIKNRLKIKWHAFLRVDRRFSVDILKTMRESGFSCTVGMESADDHTLKTLNKGYDKETIQTLFENMRRAGLTGNHLNIMIGVPGTSYAQDLATYRFCRKYTDLFNWFKSFVFTLTQTSEMGKNPHKYGIRIINDGQNVRPHPQNRLSAIDFFDPGGMSDKEKGWMLNHYDQLNREIRRDRRGNDFFGKILAARSVRELGDLTFVVPKNSLVKLHLKNVHDRSGHSTGKNGRYMIVNIREGRDHQFLVDRYLISLMDSLAEKAFSIDDVLDLTADEQRSLDFIQTLTKGELLEYYESDSIPSQ